MMTDRTRRVLDEIAFFAFFLLAAIAMTWPLVTSIGSALSDPGDPLLNTWILDWDVHALLHEPLTHLFQAPMYYPGKFSLAYSENMLMVALVTLPFRLFGVSALAAYDLAQLLGFATAGYGASVLARVTGRSRVAAMIAGILYAFCPFQLDHLAHLQITWCGFLPLIFAALFAYGRKPTWTRAWLIAAAFVANGLSNIHFLLFGGLALVLVLLWMFLAAPKRDVRYWAQLIAVLAVAGAVLLPVLIPYRVVADLYGMKRSEGEILSGSGLPSDWLGVTGRSAMWHWMNPGRDERRLFTGVMPLFLLLSAVFLVPFARRGETSSTPRRVPPALLRTLDAMIVVAGFLGFLGVAAERTRWKIGGIDIVDLRSGDMPIAYMLLLVAIRFALRPPLVLTGGEPMTIRDVFARTRFTAEEWAGAVLIVIGFFGSLGLNSFFHRFIVRTLFVFKSIRAPARWAIIAYVGLIIWSSLGIDALLRNRTGWKRAALGAVFAVLAIADMKPNIRWEHVLPEPPSVYHWMAREHVKGPYVELPMDGGAPAFFYLQGNMLHNEPIINGTSGFEPPLNTELRNMTERKEYNDVFLSRLEDIGCRYIIVHTHELNDPQAVYKWLQENLSTFRLVLVERFTHETTGDFVFALTKVNKDWQRLAHPYEPDRAGRTDGQNLLVLFLGGMPYNEETFGVIEKPEQEQSLDGSLNVRGWVLSPNGVSHVDLYFYDRRIHYDAQLVARPDVTKDQPWYPVPRPGFVLHIHKRPRGFPRAAEMQVKITDARGKETWLPERLFSWN